MAIKKILHPKLKFNDISYGFFTRNGGYSKSPYNSLNCSFNVEDNESDVKKNLLLVCISLKLDYCTQIQAIEKALGLALQSLFCFQNVLYFQFYLTIGGDRFRHFRMKS